MTSEFHRDAGTCSAFRLLLLRGLIAAPIGAAAQEAGKPAPLVIQQQGSFAVGGTVISNPGTFDPMQADPCRTDVSRRSRLRVLSDPGECAQTAARALAWRTDSSRRRGRPRRTGVKGIRTIFLRRGFAVYIIDQPRRGNAGRSTVQATIAPTPDEQFWFGLFRLGVWPNYFPGVQFSRDPEALNQYFRAMTPNTGPFDMQVVIERRVGAVRQDRTGNPRHSLAERRPWLAHGHQEPERPRHRFLRAGQQLHVPGRRSACSDAERRQARSRRVGVPLSEFMRLTKIPIVVYFGDNIPEQPTANPGEDNWRVLLAMARLWRDAVNRHGGDVTLVHLPEIGIRGNTHFPFSDLNNLEIADLMSAFLQKKGLD